MNTAGDYEGYHSLRERKFIVNEKSYTLFEYGEEFYKDSIHMESLDDLSRDDLEDWALKQIKDLMKQKSIEIIEL